MRRKAYVITGCLILLAGGINAQAQSLEELTKNDPPFVAQTLELRGVPEPAGEAISLFNGTDLKDWEQWLGYPDAAQTYQADHAPAIGRVDSPAMFTVVREDGEPALRVDGTIWGSLVHTGDYSNYHLRLEYKWSGVRHAPRLNEPENNGLLYHSHGPHGAVWGTWMASVEYEIMYGSTGMIVPVGKGLSVTTTVARDETLIDPKRRFMLGGLESQAIGNTAVWNIENASDAEKPVGEWNVLDLYVYGDKSVHVLNGVPVMQAWNLCAPDAAGVCQPLTHGRIQLQSEGAETFFRRMVLTPINALPEIHVRD